jgi:hypothetical protein
LIAEKNSIFLVQDFSMEELHVTLFLSWSLTKPHAIYNLPAGLLTNFHMGDLDVDRLNYGVITLIRKGNDAGKIQKYRPS